MQDIVNIDTHTQKRKKESMSLNQSMKLK